MEKLVCQKRIPQVRASQQLFRQGSHYCALEEGEPAAVQQDARWPLLVFSKSPERSDHRVVVRYLDRNAKCLRDVLRGEAGKAHLQLFSGRFSVRQRIADRGQLRGTVQPPAVRIRL